MSKIEKFNNEIKKCLDVLEQNIDSDTYQMKKILIQIAPFITQEYASRFKKIAALYALKDGNITLAEKLDGNSLSISKKIKKSTIKRIALLIEKRKKQLEI